MNLRLIRWAISVLVLLVVILVPMLVGMMMFINFQYRRSARELAVRPELVAGPPQRQERVVVRKARASAFFGTHLITYLVR